MSVDVLRKEAESSVNYYNNFVSKKDREDLIQDIILKVLLTDKPKNRDWIKIIAKAVIIDHVRKKDRRKTISSEDIEISHMPVAKDLLLSIELNCSKLEFQIAKMVSQGYSYQDISEIFGRKGRSFPCRVLKRISKKLEE